MTAMVVLLVIAVLLFFFEIFIPGGFLAALGMACILGAAVLAATNYGVVTGVLVFFAGTVAVIILFFVEVKWLLRAPWARRIQHEGTIAGASLKKVDVEDRIGAEAVAVTRLTPSGRIRLDGKLLEAKSENGWVEPGEKVVIVGSDVFHVWVSRKSDAP
jgi:membrane-bound serine protease (ClpP class)